MKPKIKICGIKDIKNAKVVIDNNADYLGLNFIQESKRYINERKSESLVKEIKNYILKKKSKIKLAGLFANENYDQINKFSELLDIDIIQLCGDEDITYIKKITKPVIKQIHIKETHNFSEILRYVEKYFSVSRLIILDCYSKYSKGGTGEKFNWEKYKSIIEMDDILVAGGLNPNNIGNLMDNFSPWGLDVSSGVETVGEKDAIKITEFIKIANS